MPSIYTSIDLETTGLDPEQDAIIEIGIVRFQGDDILDQWSSLVNPRRRVPPNITDLTGITQNDVDEAPTLLQVRSKVAQIVGSDCLVAHNAPFDLAFLSRNGLCKSNPALDTLELATVLLPTAGRYGLSSLAKHLEIPSPPGMHAHRALSDALVTAGLFRVLAEEAESLPLDTLEEIVAAGRAVAWPTVTFFEDALGAVSRRAFSGPARSDTGRRRRRNLFRAPQRKRQSLRPADPPHPIDPDAISGMLDAGGLFASRFANFEHRPQQVEMAWAVANTLNKGHHLMVEAGTGTGKSIAYLVPAVDWATRNSERVVISTNTINLQDQLINKDLPDLLAILPMEFQAVVLKGRSNYICPRMVNSLRRNGPTNVDEMRVLARVLIWLPHSTTGERGEIPLWSFGEQIAWSKLNADNDGCSPDSCSAFAGDCPLHTARQAAESSHLIIVNHALLLSDIVTGNKVLPDYRYLIVDEAHHLENATTNGLSFRVDQPTVERQLRELTWERGLAMEILGRCRATLPPGFLRPVENEMLLLQEAAGTAGRGTDAFFWEIGHFLQEHSGRDERQYSTRVLVTGALRRQPSWERVEIGWEEVSQRMGSLVEGLRRLETALDDISDSFELPDGEDLGMRVKTLRRELAETWRNVDELVFSPDDGTIYWAELPLRGERVSLHAAPLHVGPLVQEHIFHKKNSVILTSATMQTTSPSSDGRSGFDYLRERLHAWEADELAVGSPFDYQSSTLIYLPTDIPEPRQPGYQRLIESSITVLVRSLQGRTLVLFTAYSQLRQTAAAIRGALGDAGITLYQQGAGISRQQLLESFRAADSAVLFGTRSFWEGVDIPGPALSCVVIVKLPFDVPTDPVFAARQQSFENPFYDYAVPEAVLRFRQGFGRLIRTTTDRGIVVPLDKRLLTKAYGRFFLEALPTCTVKRGSIADMAQTATAWMDASVEEN
jgi:DNA polymerase-3 subunit epsilon/ATP-dependent DNA helicase DinG